MNCHFDGEAAYDFAKSAKSKLTGLRDELSTAEESLNVAEASGMEVSLGRSQWAGANEALVKARVKVHTFTIEPVDEIVREGLNLASQARQTGVDALVERDFRRKGLGISLISIVLVMIGLWLKVRSIEAVQR